MITREELRSRIWPQDTFVDFDNSLNTAINKLREALGDSADSPRFIETLPRRGYRFLAPVGSDEERTIKRLLGSKIALGVLISVLLAPAIWFALSKLHSSSETKQRRLTANHQDNPVLGSVISPNGKYLTFAGYILEGDDRIKEPRHAYVYHFCGIPFTSRTHLEGHAVRAMYACCGATD